MGQNIAAINRQPQILATSLIDNSNQDVTTQVANDAINNASQTSSNTSTSEITKEISETIIPTQEKTENVAQETINKKPLGKAPSYYINGWYGALNLNNPQALADAKKEALTTPLLSLVKKYGWENIFRYELLTPELLQIDFQHRANTLSFNELLTFYKGAEQALEKVIVTNPLAQCFEIPVPKLWKNVFDTETKNLHCDEIAANYPIEDLEKYEIITSSQAQALEAAVVCKQTFDTHRTELECTFEKKVEEYKTIVYDNTMSEATAAYSQHPINEAMTLKKEDTQRSSAITQTRDQKVRGLKSEAKLAPEKAQQCNAEIARIEKEATRDLSRIANAAQPQKDQLNKIRSDTKDYHQLMRDMAEPLFNLNKSRIRDEVNMLQTENLKTYNQQIDKLNKKYRAQ